MARGTGGRWVNGTLITRASILEAASDLGGVAVREVKSSSRTLRLYRVRMAYVWLAHTHLDVSWPQISKMICRDHTTAIHAYRAATNHNNLCLRNQTLQLIGAVENHFGLPYSFPDARFALASWRVARAARLKTIAVNGRAVSSAGS